MRVNTTQETKSETLKTEMMTVLIMLMIVVIKVSEAAAQGSEMDIRPGPETVLAKQSFNSCFQVKFGAMAIPSNISSNTRCL